MPFFRLSDRVKDTTSSSGVVSSYALNNSPPTGYQSFSVIQNGNVTFYTATDGTDWETGVAAYCTVFGDELVKCTVTGSSNSNSSNAFSCILITLVFFITIVITVYLKV